MFAPVALVDYVLRLGDTCLILGHRLSEWCGRAPFLEEDIAMANVALDLIGQARLWLSLAGTLERRDRDEDALAYGRDAGEFRNLLLVETHNGDFADTMVRQFLFDTAHAQLLLGLAKSSQPDIAAIAAKAVLEVTYHRERSRLWLQRLGDGTAESNTRAQRAVDRLWPYTGEMFMMDAVDEVLIAAGVAPDLAPLRDSWLHEVEHLLSQANLRRPQRDWAQSGGKQGVHTEHLGYLLAEMQWLQRAYPGLQW
jgi:ring-1,2-phenylacetyl-CoA epoxidase subunit PaaC